MITVKVAGDGLTFLYGTIIFLVMSWVVIIMRVGVRLWRKALWMDDYIMCIGLACFSVTASLGVACCYLGSGQHSRHLPHEAIQLGTKLFYIAEYFYAFGAVFIKTSVAVCLLRIAAGHQSVTWVLYGLIGISWTAVVVFIIGIANICHPIDSLWGASKGKCNSQLNSDLSLFFSIVEIFTDFGLSLLPGVLLWNVNMEFKLKVSVVVMLTLASFASCATIVRLKYLTLYNNPAEFMYGTSKIGLWSLTEECIGIIAGSLPALRPLLSLRIRITTVSKTPAASGRLYPPISSRRAAARRSNGIMMNTFQTLGDNDADHSDVDSHNNIIKETNYTVTSTPRYAINERV